MAQTGAIRNTRGDSATAPLMIDYGGSSDEASASITIKLLETPQQAFKIRLFNRTPAIDVITASNFGNNINPPHIQGDLEIGPENVKDSTITLQVELVPEQIVAENTRVIYELQVLDDEGNPIAGAVASRMSAIEIQIDSQLGAFNDPVMLQFIRPTYSARRRNQIDVVVRRAPGSGSAEVRFDVELEPNQLIEQDGITDRYAEIGFTVPSGASVDITAKTISNLIIPEGQHSITISCTWDNFRGTTNSGDSLKLILNSEDISATTSGGSGGMSVSATAVNYTQTTVSVIVS